MKLLTLPTLVLILCSLGALAQPEVSGPVPPQETIAAPEAGKKPSDPNPQQDASRAKATEEKATAKPPSLKDYCRKHTC